MNQPTIFSRLAIFVSILAIFLPGCANLRLYHHQAMMSIDENEIKNHGASFDNEDNVSLGSVNANVGYLVAESVMGGEGKSNYHHYDPSHLQVNGRWINTQDPENKDHYVNDKPTGNFFSLSEALIFVGKGGGEKFNGTKSTTSIYYLELPVLINYNHNTTGTNYLHGGLGPYAAAALFGHLKTDAAKTSLHFGNDVNSDDYKRMDYGIQFKAGYSFLKNWDVTVGYDLGLRNIFPGDDVDKANTRTLSLNIGYIF